MRRTFATIFVLTAVALARPTTAQPASRWKEIGKTSTGNLVYVDPRTVKTVNGIVTARIRVKFVPPVPTREGTWIQSHHIGMFDCAKQLVASKESVYYGDLAATKVIQRTTIAKPGFGPPIGSASMAQIAMDYVCKRK